MSGVATGVVTHSAGSSHDLTKATPRGSAVLVADHRVAGDLAAVDHHDRSLPKHPVASRRPLPLASQVSWSPSSGVQSARVRSGPRRCPVTLPRVGRARDLRQCWASGGDGRQDRRHLTELASSLSRQARGQMLPCQLSTVNSSACASFLHIPKLKDVLSLTGARLVMRIGIAVLVRFPAWVDSDRGTVDSR